MTWLAAAHCVSSPPSLVVLSYLLQPEVPKLRKIRNWGQKDQISSLLQGFHLSVFECTPYSAYSKHVWVLWSLPVVVRSMGQRQEITQDQDRNC